MKKKLLLCTILSSISLSIYSANVLIRNYSSEPVFARINDQKRFGIFDYSLFSTTRYPNFRKINPGRSLVFTTAQPQVPFKQVRPFQTTWGKLIKTVTFIRVTGSRTITGTIPELQDQVKDLANKCGNIDLKISWLNTADLEDDLSGKVNKIPLGESPYRDYSIKIPEIEEFTYTLPQGGIKKGIVELQSWGNAVFKKTPQ